MHLSLSYVVFACVAQVTLTIARRTVEEHEAAVLGTEYLLGNAVSELIGGSGAHSSQSASHLKSNDTAFDNKSKAPGRSGNNTATSRLQKHEVADWASLVDIEFLTNSLRVHSSDTAPVVLKICFYVFTLMGTVVALLGLLYLVLLWYVDKLLARAAQEALFTDKGNRLRNARREFAINGVKIVHGSKDSERNASVLNTDQQYWDAKDELDQLDQIFDQLSGGKQELTKAQTEQLCLSINGQYIEGDTDDVYPMAFASLGTHRWLLDSFDDVFTAECPLDKETFKALVGLLLLWRGVRTAVRVILHYRNAGTPMSKFEGDMVDNGRKDWAFIRVLQNLIEWSRVRTESVTGLKSDWRIVNTIDLETGTKPWMLKYTLRAYASMRVPSTKPQDSDPSQTSAIPSDAPSHDH